MIDFTVDAPQKYPGEIPTAVRMAVASRTAVRFFHHPKVLNLITDVEQRYGFTRIGMTSWAGYGVAAYLSPAQIELVRNDPLVKLVSDNAFSKFSADPPWPNVVSGNETMSWGTYAVNGKGELVMSFIYHLPAT